MVIIWLIMGIYGGFHSHGGTPSHHPFRTMGFSMTKTIHYWVPPFMETIFSYRKLGDAKDASIDAKDASMS